MNTSVKVPPRERLSAERLRRRWSQLEVADQLGTTPGNVSRWERGITSPGPYFRRKLCELFGKSAQELGLTWDASTDLLGQNLPASTLTVSSASNRLSQYIPFFAGREHLLTQLHPLLGKRAMAAIRQAISDMDGIGKTHGVHSLLIVFDEQGKTSGPMEITTMGAGTARTTVFIVEHYEDRIRGILAESANESTTDQCKDPAMASEELHLFQA